MVLLELCSIQPEQSARAVPAVLGAERRQFKDFHVGRRIQKKRENIIRSQKGWDNSAEGISNGLLPLPNFWADFSHTAEIIYSAPHLCLRGEKAIPWSSPLDTERGDESQ
jgi:hypothetical protein